MLDTMSVSKMAPYSPFWLKVVYCEYSAISDGLAPLHVYPHYPLLSSSPPIHPSLLQMLSPGSILASTQGAGGQQILHVIHTIPSVNMPSKMGQLQTIPVVVQSLPLVYTTMPTDGVATAAITVPLIGSDGRSEGSGESEGKGGKDMLRFVEMKLFPI